MSSCPNMVTEISSKQDIGKHTPMLPRFSHGKRVYKKYLRSRLLISHQMSPTSKKEEDSSSDSRSLRRRQKFEARLTSGCGFGKARLKLIDAFWSTLWPGLEELGWGKMEGTGTKEGAVYFIPKGVNFSDGQSQLGEDYFDRIRDVIDRVCSEDAKIAELQLGEAFTKDMELMDELESSDTGPGPRASRRMTRKSVQLDLSWKDGGSTYPKSSSRVGELYQAPSIPPAGSFSSEEARTDPDLQYDQIWDPERAKATGALDFSVEKKKEAALEALHKLDYKTDRLEEALKEVKTNDGSDWTEEQKEEFHATMFRLRKNIVAVAAATGFGVNESYAYYLSKFKKSNDYRLLKTICEEERLHKFAASDQGLDACGICGDGGSLLICDNCEGEYHMTCVRPPLVKVPEGTWFCDTCIDSKFLETRDKIIGKFYDEIGDSAGNKKRKANEMDETSGKSKTNENVDVVLRPSESVLAAVKALASCISQALSPNG